MKSSGWREILMTAGSFVVALLLALAVCALLAHPRHDADRLVICAAFATAVAAAVAVVAHHDPAPPGPASGAHLPLGPITVRGDDNRIVGPDASGNNLGNHGTGSREAAIPSGQPTTRPVPGPAASVADAGERAHGMGIEGHRNRVAGPGACNNTLGDDGTAIT